MTASFQKLCTSKDKRKVKKFYKSNTRVGTQLADVAQLLSTVYQQQLISPTKSLIFFNPTGSLAFNTGKYRNEQPFCF